MQSKVPWARMLAKNLRVNPLSVVPDTQPKLSCVIVDFHFDLSRLCVAECIAQGLACNPVDFVPQNWMEVSRRAFYCHTEKGGIRDRSVGLEFFSESAYGHGKVVGLDRGGAQPLHSIPALGDRLGRLIDSALETLFGFDRALREQVSSSLKAEHQSMKALQQSIVQIPSDSCPFVDACFKPYCELVV
jgi:hypothetical protein